MYFLSFFKTRLVNQSDFNRVVIDLCPARFIKMLGEEFSAVTTDVVLGDTLNVIPTCATVAPSRSEVVGRLMHLASNDGHNSIGSLWARID